MAALLVAVPVPNAAAHLVTCTNDSQEPFWDLTPAPGRARIQGATIIECTPTAPDAQRTEVQLQWRPGVYWESRGDSYISFSNARFHRVYDTTSCRQYQSHYWRVRADHTGRHGNTKTKTDYGPSEFIYCPYN